MNFLEGRIQQTCALKLKQSTPEFTWLLDAEQLIDGAIIRGGWEWYTTWAIERLIRPSMVCFDIGANIGYYTVLMAHLAPKGKSIAFEAMEEPKVLVSKHIELNSLAGIAEVSPFTPSDVIIDESSAFFNYSWPPSHVEQKHNPMQFRTLDWIVEQGFASPPDFIKLDVDGYELKILQGAKNILTKYKPRMLIEVCDYTLRQAAHRAADTSYAYGTESAKMLTYLQSIGYQFFYEETFKRAVDIPSILQSADLSKTSINLICSAGGNLP